jgi:hypothetical protein
MKNQTFTYTLQLDTEINSLMGKLSTLKKGMENAMAAGKAPGAEKAFASIESAIDKLRRKTSEPITSLAQFESVKKGAADVAFAITKLSEKAAALGNLSLEDKMDLLPKDLLAKINAAGKALEAYAAETEKASQKSEEFAQAQAELARA